MRARFTVNHNEHVSSRPFFSIHSRFTLSPRAVSGSILGTDVSSARRSLAPPAVELIDILLCDRHATANTERAARYFQSRRSLLAFVFV